MSISSTNYALELYTSAYQLLKSSNQAVTFSSSQKSGQIMSIYGRSGSADDVISFSLEAIAALANSGLSSSARPIQKMAQVTSGADLGKFAQAYARHAADGVEGRFYKSTDPETLTGMMSPDQAASFMEAYKNKTLKIQTFEDAGVKSGDLSVTFSDKSQTTSGGDARGPVAVDATSVMKTSKYALTSIDPFFGGYVVSWGGPPS